jgi:hypothetical protein
LRSVDYGKLARMGENGIDIVFMFL